MVIIYSLMKAACKKIEEKYERKANEKAAEIPNEKRCARCPYGKFDKGPTAISSGFIYQLNPIERIAVGGLWTTHLDRKKALEEREDNE